MALRGPLMAGCGVSARNDLPAGVIPRSRKFIPLVNEFPDGRLSDPPTPTPAGARAGVRSWPIMAGMSDLTIAEAATVAGVSVRTVRRWIASGQVVTTGRG